MMKTRVAILLLLFAVAGPLWASEKNWTGGGDGIYWNDDTNWFPVMTPSAADEVIVNAEDAPVTVREGFTAKSISIGGNVTSSIAVDSGISGTVVPASADDIAVLNGIKGKLILKGADGVMTLRGKYKDSETPLSDEPALVIYFE